MAVGTWETDLQGGGFPREAEGVRQEQRLCAPGFILEYQPIGADYRAPPGYGKGHSKSGHESQTRGTVS